MNQYRGRYRPVLVSAPSEEDEDLANQRALFATAVEGARDRDIALIEIVGSNVETVIGPACTGPAEEVRSQLSIANDRFSFVLIGKDGGVKLRSDDVVAADDLFALIDSMPMRQREIHQR